MTKKTEKLTVIDFFCGAGGFSEGLRQAGFEIIMGVDNWAPAIMTHNLNHGLNDSASSVLEFEDIENIYKLPDSEIIVGSPPCVSFSLSNRGGNADKALGIRLIEAYLRVIAVKKHQPGSRLKAWLMENVPNSRNFVREQYTFTDLNLDTWAVSHGINPSGIALQVRDNGAILRASDFGAAQVRNRFVCGEIVSTGAFPMPQTTRRVLTVAEIRDALPAPLKKSAAKAAYVDPNYPNLVLKGSQITDHHYDTGVYEIEWQRAKAAKINHPYMGRMSFPENESKPSRTIMATRSASTREAILYRSEVIRQGNGEYRLPTVREAASIMGFPLSYVFFGNEATKWRQIGNAVCPQLAAALGHEIKLQLGISTRYTAEFHLPEQFDSARTLDDYTIKTFDRPPRRNPRALFRHHPVKSGNMTVALTNRNPITGANSWAAIAFMGTGKGYRAVDLSSRHRQDAGKLLAKVHPDFLEKIEKDESLKSVSHQELDRLNGDYHYHEKKGEHPLSLINKVGDYIAKMVDSSSDRMVSTTGTILESLKDQLPLSQLMAIYAVKGIVSPEEPQ